MVCVPSPPMEPMQLEGARSASCVGSDDRRSFRGDCHELTRVSVERCRIDHEAVGVRVSGARGGITTHVTGARIIEPNQREVAVRCQPSCSMCTSRESQRRQLFSAWRAWAVGSAASRGPPLCAKRNLILIKPDSKSTMPRRDPSRLYPRSWRAGSHPGPWYKPLVGPPTPHFPKPQRM